MNFFLPKCKENHAKTGKAEKTKKPILNTENAYTKNKKIKILREPLSMRHVACCEPTEAFAARAFEGALLS